MNTIFIFETMLGGELNCLTLLSKACERQNHINQLIRDGHKILNLKQVGLLKDYHAT